MVVIEPVEASRSEGRNRHETPNLLRGMAQGRSHTHLNPPCDTTENFGPGMTENVCVRIGSADSGKSENAQIDVDAAVGGDRTDRLAVGFEARVAPLEWLQTGNTGFASVLRSRRGNNFPAKWGMFVAELIVGNPGAVIVFPPYFGLESIHNCSVIPRSLDVLLGPVH